MNAIDKLKDHLVHRKVVSSIWRAPVCGKAISLR
jgi:hypothetical protein